MPATASPISDIRRSNLQKLIQRYNGGAALAKKLGYKDASFISQLAGKNAHKAISEKIARNIESQLGLPEGWLDSGEPHDPYAEYLAIEEAKQTPLAQGVRSALPNGAVLIDRIATLFEGRSVQPTPRQMADITALAMEHAAIGPLTDAFLGRLVRLVSPE